MAEILMLHHALGLTKGVLGFADELRAAGHSVHTPDVYDGNVFDNLDDGIAYAQGIGFAKIRDRGIAAAEGLPDGIVCAGFSLGVMAAQQLAQTRPGAKGALLFYSCIPPSDCGGQWPPGLPAQVHLMDRDPFALEGDLEAAVELSETQPTVELWLYEGDGHLFADATTADFDEHHAAVLKERVLRFLAKVD